MENFIHELKAELAEIKKAIMKAKPTVLMTSREVMKMLKISRNSFNRLKDEGIIKVYSLRGKLYCKEAEILEVLESGRVN